jgi:hypothetical protein
MYLVLKHFNRLDPELCKKVLLTPQAACTAKKYFLERRFDFFFVGKKN